VEVVLATSSYPLRPDDSAAAAGLFVCDFAAEMARQGHSVRVLTQAREGPIDDDPSFEVTRYAWRGNQSLSTLRPTRPRDLRAIASVVTSGMRALDRALTERPADLVLAFWAVPAGLLALRARRRFGVPYRVWALGSDIWSYGRNPMTRWMVRRVLRGADRCFADGLELASEVTHLSGCDCAFLPSSRRMPIGLPVPPELEAGRKNLVFIGRFHENKGVDLLVEALGAISPEMRRGLCCFLFGGGPLEQQVADRLEALALGDSVRVLGYASRERVAAFLEHCDALIIPSRIESIPVVLSDAAQAGCPIVATDVGDMGRLLERYPAGERVAPEAASIRDGILRLEERGRYTEGLAQLARDFSLEESVKQALADRTAS
jgi:glycosyltransferase involved in cell wall biosynthesis